MASLHSPPLYSSKRVMGLPTLPSTTVEDDPYIAPAPKLPEQLLVSVQTGAGHDKDEHVYVPASRRLVASHSPSSSVNRSPTWSCMGGIVRASPSPDIRFHSTRFIRRP